jgi:hypothetical protein
MKNFTWVFSALIALLLASSPSLAEIKLEKKFSDVELLQILQDEGFRSVELKDDGVILIKVDGAPYVLYNYDDGDLQLYYGIGGARVSVEAINNWNMTRRLTRAYIDSQNDPVLEADLLASGGLSSVHVTEFMDVFLGAANTFRSYVQENDQAEMTEQQAVAHETVGI